MVELRGSPGRPPWLGAALVAPALLVSALVIAYPVWRTVSLSTSDATMATLDGGGSFVGGRNFVAAVKEKEFGRFRWSLLMTAAFAGASAFGSIAVGLAAAMLLAGPTRGRVFWRTLSLFPYAAPVAATAFAWQWILHFDHGAVNTLLARLGGEEWKVAWLTGRATAFAICVLFQVWRYFPFAMLLVLARLRSIPPSLYEAASVDGAGAWQSFRYITWPQLAPLCALLFFLRMLWTFNKFDDVFLLTGGRGWTHVATIELYDQAFGGRQHFGMAAAMAIIVLLSFAAFAVSVKGVRAWLGARG